MWFSKSDKEIELEHQVRLKCLESGFPLPDADLAWVKVVELRGSQTTAALIVGTVALVCGPVGTTAIILSLGRDLLSGWLAPLAILLVWIICGYLLHVLFRRSLQTLGDLKRPTDFAVRAPQVNGLKLTQPETASERIQQKS